MFRLSSAVPAALLIVAASATARDASAASCHVVNVGFTVADDAQSNAFPPQIVVWLEDPNGHYVDTLYITQKTGHFGIGNRPGRLDFKSGPLWPYGRREEVFPVWAHRHGVVFPRIDYQDYVPLPCTDNSQCGTYVCDPYNHECADSEDTDLSHSKDNSSNELSFCRPLAGPTNGTLDGAGAEPKWQTAIDTGTCASTSYTDKGHFSTTITSNYPPRSDLSIAPENSDDAATYAMINPFDAVSQPTPHPSTPAEIVWPIPDGLPSGSYTLYAEVSKEFDFNAAFTQDTYPSPDLPYWGEYGIPARGQPSVVYKVPFVVGSMPTTATALHYVGYGDPTGQDGDIREPDSSIDESNGTGAGRLQITAAGDQMYRLKVDMEPLDDVAPPAAPVQPLAQNVDVLRADVSFIEGSGDNGLGAVHGYEIRYLADQEITEANFDAAQPITTAILPEAPGTLQEFPMENLIPSTTYSVGIRAFDACHNTGPLSVVTFTTLDRASGEVDACFIATAAYGSLMANEVTPLRSFRDRVLRNSALGELAVEAYYTFGPALAGTIGESELLRATARDLLAPVIAIAKRY